MSRCDDKMREKENEKEKGCREDRQKEIKLRER